MAVSLNLTSPHWQVELNYALDKSQEDQPVTRRKWLEVAAGKKKGSFR